MFSCQIEIYAWYIWHQQSTLSLTEKKTTFVKKDLNVVRLQKGDLIRGRGGEKPALFVQDGSSQRNARCTNASRETSVPKQLFKDALLLFLFFYDKAFGRLTPVHVRTYLMSFRCAVMVQKVVTYLLVISLSDVQIAPVLKAICCQHRCLQNSASCTSGTVNVFLALVISSK